MSKGTRPADAGLAEIDAWHEWFVAAHTARLRDASLTADVMERELGSVTTQTAAIAARMRAEPWCTSHGS
jgi:hypothetical protein